MIYIIQCDITPAGGLPDYSIHLEALNWGQNNHWVKTKMEKNDRENATLILRRKKRSQLTGRHP